MSGGTRFKHSEKLFAHRSWRRSWCFLAFPGDREEETDTHAGHIHNLARHLDNINVCSLALSAAPSSPAAVGKPKRIRRTDTQTH